MPHKNEILQERTGAPLSTIEKRIRRVERLARNGKAWGIALIVSFAVMLTLFLGAEFGLLDRGRREVVVLRVLSGFAACGTLTVFIVNFKLWSNELIATVRDEHLGDERTAHAFEFVMDILQHRSNYGTQILTGAESAFVSRFAQGSEDGYAEVEPRHLPCLYACLKQPNDALVSTALGAIEARGGEAAVPPVKELIDRRDSTLHDESVYAAAKRSLSALEARFARERIPQTLLRESSAPTDALLRPSQEAPTEPVEAKDRLP